MNLSLIHTFPSLEPDFKNPMCSPRTYALISFLDVSNKLPHKALHLVWVKGRGWWAGAYIAIGEIPFGHASNKVCKEKKD